jgi:hypothetical protein
LFTPIVDSRYYGRVMENPEEEKVMDERRRDSSAAYAPAIVF